MEELTLKQRERLFKHIIYQTIIYSLIVLSFFISLYENRIVYISSLVGIFAISIYLYYRMYKRRSDFGQLLYYFILLGILLLIFLPLNIFYVFIGEPLFNDAIGISFNFDFILFGYFYFWLTIGAIISQTIIALFYRFARHTIPESKGYGIWDYFLQDISIINVFLLLALLSVASIFEEIVFRFLIINILDVTGLNIILIIIISAIIFGLAHYNNGGWIFCINSTWAGIIFAISFIQMGILSAWFLHFLWNFLVVYQMFIPKIYEGVSESSEDSSPLNKITKTKAKKGKRVVILK